MTDHDTAHRLLRDWLAEDALLPPSEEAMSTQTVRDDITTRLFLLVLYTACAVTVVNLLAPTAPFWDRVLATGALIALRTIR